MQVTQPIPAPAEPPTPDPQPATLEPPKEVVLEAARRLPFRLRLAAQMARSPPTHRSPLVLAAMEYFGARFGLLLRSAAMANALTDLAVSGRKAYENFAAAPPTLQALMDMSPDIPAGDKREQACRAVLSRAYQVAWALRGPPEIREDPPIGAGLRKKLKWIAVSGEDDPPHRPVNVLNAKYPQFDIEFEVNRPTTGLGGKFTVKTRYFVASKGNTQPPSEEMPWRNFDELPPDFPELLPVVPEGDRVILFLHGDSSNAEEALELTDKLLDAGEAKGVPLCVVSLDLPNCGYGRRFEHYNVAPTMNTTLTPLVTPTLEFVEEYFCAFVEALDALTPIKDRIIGVVGGSLGGNLGLRLGRRDFGKYPWLGSLIPRQGPSPNPGIVSFSPASVWNQVSDPVKWKLLTEGPLQSLRLSWQDGEGTDSEPVDKRKFFFYEVFDKPLASVPGALTGAGTGAGIGALVGGYPGAAVGALIGAVAGGAIGDFIALPAQPQTWYGPNFKHKPQFIEWARASQEEVYDPIFRRWHWRMCFEQTVSSHLIGDNVGAPICINNHGRTLLMAGSEDDFMGANIYTWTRALAPKMIQDRGRTIFLQGVGHSIPAEKPLFMTEEMVKFLIDEAGIAGIPPAGKEPPTFISSLVLAGPAHAIAASFVYDIANFLLDQGKQPAPDRFANWHSIRVAFDDPARGGTDGNATVQGRFGNAASGLIYVARDIGQIELTLAKTTFDPAKPERPARVSRLSVAHMRQFSAALGREIDAGVSLAADLRKVRECVDEIAAAAT